jgi:uncharacterized metal-binding protein YceD (DUF177 family)
MTRPSGTTDARDPWRAPVLVTQIPDGGLHRDIVADQATLAAMADAAGVRELGAAHASFELTLKSNGRVHVTGLVQARVGQICVVTLDPIENEIDETVDLMFVPPELMPQTVHSADDGPPTDAEELDPPEPIDNGVIDLGRLATDVIYLAIDPYPRKPGAAFELEVTAVDPEDHPFAALKALRTDSASEATKPGEKSKGMSKGKTRET